ncbi:LysM peptidoglycan-binding domain-containing protein [Levilactobacillus suantsaii]|uniref:LysM peptidoglycan-binding domain-containing protein n=1 Tax=Levilactobacillus suantsaii TaxID=2292255 RepID=A0A4Q0VKE7_9LACO|nr:LysM peptidoglycan-binding domain-containing protein [Levilactobacillus suantsaii]RXI78787.1 LysM peptidoglycan-binding domain-containing protein [Levilactobacillus suantsaii]
MNKFVTTFFATTAAAVGLFFAGSVNADASTTYTVKSGDSVWAISQKYNTTINAIETANHIQNHLILPGQHLTITDGTSTTKTQTTYTTPAKSTQSSTYSNQASSNNSSQANTSSNYSSNNYSNQANTTSTQSTSNASSSNSSNSSSSNSSYTGSNLKSYVLSQMSSRTGVSASTWNTIIQRESNWQPSVRNSSSGAYGLFQNMHISSGSVSEQVDAAVSLYNAQGMSAWAL